MFLKLRADGPLHQQIYQGLRDAILSGALAPGARMMSSRELAKETGVSRNTVLLAYDQLLAEGYINGRLGSGTFVAAELPDEIFPARQRAGAHAAVAHVAPRLSQYARRTLRALPPLALPPARTPRYDFRYGLPSIQDFPLPVWRKLVTRALQKPTLCAFTYGPPEGLPQLREALVGYLKRMRAVNCEPSQIVVVNGSQQALDLISRVLLDPGDRVLIEDPHYLGARQAFLAVGARLIAAPVDDEGLAIEAVPAAARKASLVYVTPSHQFPTGAVMPLSRRLSLLKWAQQSNAYVVEDDYDSEYRYDGRPIEAVQSLDRNGQVIYVGTLSKTLFPALRIGYLVLPPHLVQQFCAAKLVADRHTPTLQQRVLADFIEEGHFERHLRRTRKRNAARRAALLEALRERFGDSIEIAGSSGGLHMLVWLNGISASRLALLLERAASADIGAYSISPYYLKPPRRSGLLLGYAALDEADIRRGVDSLRAVVASLAP